MSKRKTFTQAQQNVIDFRGKNMLVSASAGTGKTTVMIERIVSLIEQGVDVSEIVVVTFTNLAAAEMKARLATKLSEKRNDTRIVEQIEKLDTASICTLHSFCSELLRNYFYVVDIDPSFAILDSVTTTTLRKNALDDVYARYFEQNDEIFGKVYKIFATHRREETFKETILQLYNFSRCLEDFSAWYQQKRTNLLEYSEDNPIVVTIKNDIAQLTEYYAKNLSKLAERASDEQLGYAEVFDYNAKKMRDIRLDTLEHALCDVYTLQLEPIPQKKRNAVCDEIEESIRKNFADLKKDVKEQLVDKYSNICRGEDIATLWRETQQTTVYTDKLVEIVQRFDDTFYEAKKQRGGVDFNDLEHLTLKLLNNDEALAEIKSRYKLIFVDEYQDTNPVQEAIISKLAQDDNLFMVGDVKQSIYGFRGCEPSIFVDKYRRYDADGIGRVEKLNDNFRSNYEILDFVNDIFNCIMTDDFGKVDYRATAQLRGDTPPTLKTVSTRIDLIQEGEKQQGEIDDIYDITAENTYERGFDQGEVIARRIKEYVGMGYRDKDGVSSRINYGDIVILMRSLTNKAIDIYNTLISHNIPVSASFKVEGFASKEVRDLINLFRAIDNPYNDVYLVGACLSFGEMNESELGIIRLDTEGRVPFYERLNEYAERGTNDTIVAKINAFLEFLREIRFYSRSASVCEVALKVLQLKNYHLRVQSMPNGGLRLNKLYAFIDSVKDATYGQSIDKFLAFVDEADNPNTEEGLNSANTVRLMTMHASKGLEFPVVIIAGVDSPFSFIRYSKPAVDTNTDMGIAIRYYNFANMRVADTLVATACNMVNTTKQREEEMRLLYVSMTRAKFALNIVGTVTKNQLTALPKLPTRATTYLDWLMIALKTQHKWIDSADSVVNVVDTLQDLSTEKHQIPLCQQTVSTEDVLRQLKFEYGYASATDMPSKLVSSALDKEYLDSTDDPQPNYTLNTNNDRNFIGTAYHKVYQYVNYSADVNEIRQTIGNLVNDGRIEQRFAEELDVELIYETLRNPQLQRLMKLGKAYHEIPFMMYVPYNQVKKDKDIADKLMVQGVIDLLIIADNKAIVVDFKYTAHSDKIEQNYTAQLNSYKLAVKNICQVDDVSCYVLSIADNKLVPM